ncbi:MULTISPECIES: type III secretion system HrpP C-terminal domain-containing protein [unclassified Pseudomonas]|uniref:type III secretion system HrpP C-terminal domain-containing protein n=1 Tax=unclassified Pseudomonas TaxID=196821 RepID=UPI0030D746B3
MNPRHATLKAPPRPPEAPRPRQETVSAWPVRSERRHDLRGETRDESEQFEQLLQTFDNLAPSLMADVGGSGFQDPQQHPDSSSQGAAVTPEPSTLALWETLLARLEQHLDELQPGVLEAHLELPNLGTVKVNVTPRGTTLEIAVHMAREAWRQVEPQQQASAAWLAQQLGRTVRLSLHREDD